MGAFVSAVLGLFDGTLDAILGVSVLSYFVFLYVAGVGLWFFFLLRDAGRGRQGRGQQ